MIRSAVLVAAEELRTHLLRTLLAALSVTIGVASVVLAISLRDNASGTLIDALEQQSGREATYQIDTHNVTPAQVEAILTRLDHYRVAATPVSLDGRFAQPWRAAGLAVAPDYAQVRGIQVMRGRWLRPSDHGQLTSVLVVNRPLAEFLPTVIPGVIGTVPGTTTVVVGVVDDGAAVPRYYSPAPAAAADPPMEILFLAPPGARIDTAVQRDLRLIADDPTPAVSRIDEMANWRELLTLVRTVLGAIALLTLLVGAVGLLNLGLSSVKDRVREIGIRRSFGARRSDVFAAILTETVITTLVAAAAGAGLAALVLELAPELAGMPLSAAAVSPYAVVVAVAVALGVGVGVGLLPAYRATRIDVIAAIRR
jgi:putative ABC transport system permease protein